MGVADMSTSRGTADVPCGIDGHIHRFWPRRSTNLEAGGELAPLAYQIGELKSQKLGQDQNWCITGA